MKEERTKKKKKEEKVDTGYLKGAGCDFWQLIKLIAGNNNFDSIQGHRANLKLKLVKTTGDTTENWVWLCLNDSSFLGSNVKCMRQRRTKGNPNWEKDSSVWFSLFGSLLLLYSCHELSMHSNIQQARRQKELQTRTYAKGPEEEGKDRVVTAISLFSFSFSFWSSSSFRFPHSLFLSFSVSLYSSVQRNTSTIPTQGVNLLVTLTLNDGEKWVSKRLFFNILFFNSFT